MVNIFRKSKKCETPACTVTEEDKRKALNKIILEKTAPYGKPYAKSNENIILSKKYRWSQDDNRSENNNILVTGGSSEERINNIVKPNILREYGSYMVVDPDARMYHETASVMKDAGYDVRVLDFTGTIENTSHFNPIAYLKNANDVRDFVECYIENRDPREDDDEWKEAHRYILIFSLLYLIHNKPEKANIDGLTELLTGLATDSETLDTMISEMPDSPYYQYLDAFLLGTDDEARAIAFSTLRDDISKMFENNTIRRSVREDDLNLWEEHNRRVVYICVEEKTRAEQILTVSCLMAAYNAKMNHSKELYGAGKTVTSQEMFIIANLLDYAYIPCFIQSMNVKRKYGISFIVLVGSTRNLEKRHNCSTTEIYSSYSVSVSFGVEKFNNTKYPISENDARDTTVPEGAIPMTADGCVVNFLYDHVAFLDALYDAC